MKPELSRQFFEKCWNMKFHENVGAELFHGDRQTDGLAHIAKLMVAFHNSANVPKTFPVWWPPGWNKLIFILCDFAQWYLIALFLATE